jgi:ribonucleotide monophosphatase NagD (HAD superfamily)
MLLCVDLDGVVYRGSEPVPGVGPLLTARRAAGDQIVYVTNNSFLRLDEYRARIESCGAPFSEEGIVTAAAAVAERFLAEGRSRILVFGAAGLVAWLSARGLDARRATTIPDEAALVAWAPNGVTVGLDRESGARELAFDFFYAQLLLLRSIHFIDHGIPNSARELQPVQINRTVFQ